jgi:peroxiredoxin
MLEIGQKLPGFQVTDHTGRPFTNDHLGGRWTVLWWFPAAYTPG